MKLQEELCRRILVLIGMVSTAVYYVKMDHDHAYEVNLLVHYPWKSLPTAQNFSARHRQRILSVPPAYRQVASDVGMRAYMSRKRNF